MNPGDDVYVVMTSKNIFPWQTEPSFRARFQSGPSGPGDFWTVTVDEGKTIVKINGNGRAFIGIWGENKDG